MPPALRSRIRFDRHEVAGSFGDIGTDLPLIVGMILAAGLDSAGVFIMFGLAQVVTGLVYGLPMPMQPLKAMAVLVIAANGEIPAEVLFGAGLAIGVVMLVLALSGALTWLTRAIPTCVVRGIQLGLALKLGHLALGRYVPAEGAAGYSAVEAYAIAAVGFVVMIALWRNRHVPAGLVLIALGAIYALFFHVDTAAVAAGAGFDLPQPNVPMWDDIWLGLWVLALPQLPLSLSNSVIATNQTIRDLFPERDVGVRRIGTSYGVANLLVPWLSGIPMCHGCGGLAGHHALGARTGGSVVIYGSMFLVIGLFFSGSFAELVQVFPLPVLGVVLTFEALALMLLMKDQMGERKGLAIAMLTALIAFAVTQGFVIGLLVGTALFYGSRYVPMLRGNEERSPQSHGGHGEEEGD
ncbi:MAG: putative sulfate/molybdate transporter [Planctomycetota bacterium]|jgi:xanthine/uracil permease